MPVKYVILNVTIHCTIVTENIHKYPVKKNYDKLPSYATVGQSKQNEGKKEKKVRKKGGGKKVRIRILPRPVAPSSVPHREKKDCSCFHKGLFSSMTDYEMA